jgi:hypothetical protein
MATKSNPNIQKRIPRKWRNLPAFGHGIIPAMKARPMIRCTPNEEIEGRLFDDLVELMPVPMTTFLVEHAAMIEKGYHAYYSDACEMSCQMCAHENSVMFVQYAKRYRNGKPILDWSRDFNICGHCLHVSEQVFVIRDTGEIYGKPAEEYEPVNARQSAIPLAMADEIDRSA